MIGKNILVTMATGRYAELLMVVAENWAEHLAAEDSVVVVALSDRYHELESAVGPKFRRLGIEFRAEFTEHLPWPDITLMRYEILRQFFLSNHLSDSRLERIIWLDCDMKFLRAGFFEKFDLNSLTVVPHTGYANRTLRMIVRRDPSEALNFAKRAIAPDTEYLGQWETNPLSTAFVERHRRLIYVHGAVWGGSAEKVLEMISHLADNVNRDTSRGLVARWHDESHLNQWVSNRNQAVKVTSKRFTRLPTDGWLFRKAFLENLEKHWLAASRERNL